MKESLRSGAIPGVRLPNCWLGKSWPYRVLGSVLAAQASPEAAMTVGADSTLPSATFNAGK